MKGEPQSATIYVWERELPFKMDYLLFPLGGPLAPTMEEIRGHRGFGVRPIHCTEDFRIYPISLNDHMENRNKRDNPIDRLAASLRHYPIFSTPLVQERFSKYHLQLPDHEVIFCPRALEADGINAMKIAGAAAYLDLVGFEVLAVPGTQIEEDQLYASRDIAEKLGMQIATPA